MRAHRAHRAVGRVECQKKIPSCIPRGGGGATTNGPDATSPQLSVKTRGGGGQLGSGGGMFLPGVGGGSGRGVRGRPARGEGGGLGLGSPSWWNQSWFYNPF